MTPPNLGSGGGSCLPLSDVVALGDPTVPVTCCACATLATPRPTTASSAIHAAFVDLILSPPIQKPPESRASAAPRAARPPSEDIV